MVSFSFCGTEVVKRALEDSEMEELKRHHAELDELIERCSSKLDTIATLSGSQRLVHALNINYPAQGCMSKSRMKLDDFSNQMNAEKDEFLCDYKRLCMIETTFNRGVVDVGPFTFGLVSSECCPTALARSPEEAFCASFKLNIPDDDWEESKVVLGIMFESKANRLAYIYLCGESYDANLDAQLHADTVSPNLLSNNRTESLHLIGNRQMRVSVLSKIGQLVNLGE